jgi:predicted DCC family thiol-disulfide oxidoreductase YuxK
MQAERAVPYTYRSDARVPAFPDDRPIIIFDGLCVLCSRFVAFVLRRDKKRVFRLLAAQSPLGEALYRHYGLRAPDYETYLLLADGEVREKSDAALRIARLLGFPWSIAGVFSIVPRGGRDAIYDFVARNRLRWFGARQSCYAPEAADAERFLS